MDRDFFYDESSSSFFGDINILGIDIEFEVRSGSSVLDYVELEKFISWLNRVELKETKETGVKLLLNFIDLVPLGLEKGKYDFNLESLIYYGKVDNFVFDNMVYGYDLVFKLYHPNYCECFDPYGNYIVRIDNRLITGIKRE